MSLILDSSATLAFLLPDEVTPATYNLLEYIFNHGAIAPTFWRIEVANALTIAVRRGRITTAQRAEAFADLSKLGIHLEDEHQAWTSAIHLADHYRLTIYDAIYLETALRRQQPLATLDRALIAAAQSEGVSLFLDTY